MYLRICPIFSPAINPLRRTMSSLAPGFILPGAHWDYHILETVKEDNTHASTIFKAQIVPRENTINAPRWFIMCINRLQTLRLILYPRVIIKAASPDDTNAMENLNREIQSYLLPGVASAIYFRQLYDVMDNNTLALEWLDTTLAEVRYQPSMHAYTLTKTVLDAAFLALE